MHIIKTENIQFHTAVWKTAIPYYMLNLNVDRQSAGSLTVGHHTDGI